MIPEESLGQCRNLRGVIIVINLFEADSERPLPTHRSKISRLGFILPTRFQQVF